MQTHIRLLLGSIGILALVGCSGYDNNYGSAPGYLVNGIGVADVDANGKLDIRRGPTPDSYILTFYMEDFAPREIPIMLNNKREFLIKFRNEDDEQLLFFAKDFNVFNGP